MNDRRKVHSPAVIEEARRLSIEGLSMAQVAKKLWLRKGQVVGIAHRNSGFPKRPERNHILKRMGNR